MSGESCAVVFGNFVLSVLRLGHHLKDVDILEMPLERFQGFAPEQKDDGVALLQEMLGRCRSTSSGAEVVDEPDRVLLEGNGGAAGRDEDDLLIGFERFAEAVDLIDDRLNVFWAFVFFEELFPVFTHFEIFLSDEEKSE